MHTDIGGRQNKAGCERDQNRSDQSPVKQTNEGIPNDDGLRTPHAAFVARPGVRGVTLPIASREQRALASQTRSIHCASLTERCCQLADMRGDGRSPCFPRGHPGAAPVRSSTG